jgi:hypothetical protein
VPHYSMTTRRSFGAARRLRAPSAAGGGATRRRGGSLPRRSHLVLSLPRWRGAMTSLRSICGTGSERRGGSLCAAGRWGARFCARDIGGIWTAERARAGSSFCRASTSSSPGTGPPRATTCDAPPEASCAPAPPSQEMSSHRFKGAETPHGGPHGRGGPPPPPDTSICLD